MKVIDSFCLGFGIFLVGMGVILGSHKTDSVLAVSVLGLGSFLVALSAYKPASRSIHSEQEAP